jgi:hypothetical protein
MRWPRFWLLLLPWVGACSSSEESPPPTEPSPIAEQCSATCEALAQPGCAAADCLERCQELALQDPRCEAETLALLDCFAREPWPGCQPPSTCMVEAGEYAACQGALGCLQDLSCTSRTGGCDCVTSCAGFTLQASCELAEASCTCLIDGPLGVGEAQIQQGCTAVESNKWCATQPLGCCAPYFGG